MSRRSNEERAKRIAQYYVRHEKNRKKTYDHFMDEGLCKKTIYHVLRRHDQDGDVSFKKPTGRKVSVCTPEMFDKLANLFKDKPDLSCREAAKQLGVARTTIFRIMAKMREKKIETYKVIESEPRCPTCHQRVDPEKLKKVKEGRKRRKKIDDSVKHEPNDNADDDDDEDDDVDEEESLSRFSDVFSS